MGVVGFRGEGMGNRGWQVLEGAVGWWKGGVGGIRGKGEGRW